MARELVQGYGHLKAFRPEEETITTYLERAELYFEANGIAANKQVSVLLTVIGPKNYALLKSLTAPELPKEKSLRDLKKALTDHFQPEPLVIAERFRFYQRAQEAGESVLDYSAELRRLAITCKFDAFLSDALRDRFVCGLKSEAIQKKLLAEAALTIDRAVEIARGMEVAAADARELKQPSGFTSSSTSSGKILNTETASKPPGRQSCYRCGKSGHDGRTCRYKEATCHACGRKGHIAPACRSHKKRKGSGKGAAHQIDANPPEETTASIEAAELGIYTSTAKSPPAPPILVDLQLNGRTQTFEVDTGAAVTLMSQSTFRKLFPKVRLSPTSLKLRTYTKEPMKVEGTCPVGVRYQDQSPCTLDLVIVAGSGPCLLGRNWLQHIRLDWPSISKISSETAVQDTIDEFQDVFAKELGVIKPFSAKLNVKRDARPKFHRARPVPFAVKPGVEEALDRLEADGIIEPIGHSDWAAPIVAVPKKDGTIRVCGDYSVTVNPELDVEQYPLPRQEDIFSSLANGKKFSTLDLSHAYNQLVLDEDSQKYVVVNTHRDLYRYKRLPFGIASAPALFQRVMDQILQGLPHVACYLDDIIITGKTHKEHLDNLAEVLRRLRKHGVRLNLDKCRFMQDSVEYLGHKIDAQGLHAVDSKLRAITEAPAPTCVQELRAFLGLLNYYGRFIPNRAALSQPLNSLLCKDTPWNWTQKCSQAFKRIKDTLVSSNFLTHYNPDFQVKLAGDASSYGVGAVISHIMGDGTEHPIAFASRTLSQSERNYSQIEKEALSLIYGVKKFRTYLYGRRFTIITDHKPLTTIFGPKHGVPPLAAARLQRWALILSSYSYDIEYRSTHAHANADCLSRLPLRQSESDITDNAPSVFNVGQIEKLPVTSQELQAATRTDPQLSKVLRAIQTGWARECEEDLKPYWSRKYEMTVEGGCILWGIRVVVPKKLQQRLLDELHKDHPGITRMKTVARSYFWWPQLDKAIENMVKSCEACQAVKHSPAVAPLQPWVWPTRPWVRVHLDFAGPFQGYSYLVAVDAHSKWPEAVIMKETTTAKTLDALRTIFASFGIPEQLVTDNGPQFTSEDFAMFSKANEIKHIRCAPYHPASNGLAERFVQSLKMGLKANLSSGLSVQRRVSDFLFNYRNTPHGTTGVSPASLFLHRQLRTRLDMLRPDRESEVLTKQSKQKSHHDQRAQERQFFVGQSVMAKNLRPGPDWVPAVVVERLGPLTYLVETTDRLLWKRHIDLLRELSVRSLNPQATTGAEQPEEEVPDLDIPVAAQGQAVPNPDPPAPAVPPDGAPAAPTPSAPAPAEAELRYPTRERNHPNWYGEWSA